MSARETFTDSSLVAMLDRRAQRSDPVGLRERVLVELESAPSPRLSWLSRPAGRLPMPWPAAQPAWALLLLAGLLIALVGGALVGSRLILDRLDGPAPPPTAPWATPPDRWVLDPVPPLQATGVAAVSADEAWATDGEALWHFVDGAWDGPFAEGLPALTAVEAAAGAARVGEIAVAPDGTLWASLPAGVAAFRDGSWDLVVDDRRGGPGSLAIDPAGAIWAGRPGDGWYGTSVRRIDGRTGVVSEVVCGYPSAMVVADDGALYVHGTHPAIPQQLWVLRDGTCEQLDPPGSAGADAWVDSMVRDPAGGVVALLRNTTGAPDQRLVRFDGEQWATLRSFGDYGEDLLAIGDGTLAAIDPAGGAWVTDRGRGVRRFDGTQWTDMPDTAADTYAIAMAPDGAVWIAGPSGVERLVPTWDAATSTPAGG